MGEQNALRRAWEGFSRPVTTIGAGASATGDAYRANQEAQESINKTIRLERQSSGGVQQSDPLQYMPDTYRRNAGAVTAIKERVMEEGPLALPADLYAGAVGINESRERAVMQLQEGVAQAEKLRESQHELDQRRKAEVARLAAGGSQGAQADLAAIEQRERDRAEGKKEFAVGEGADITEKIAEDMATSEFSLGKDARLPGTNVNVGRYMPWNWGSE